MICRCVCIKACLFGNWHSVRCRPNWLFRSCLAVWSCWEESSAGLVAFKEETSRQPRRCQDVCYKQFLPFEVCILSTKLMNLSDMLSLPGIAWMQYTWKNVKFYFKQEALKWWWPVVGATIGCCGEVFTRPDPVSGRVLSGRRGLGWLHLAGSTIQTICMHIWGEGSVWWAHVGFHCHKQVCSLCLCGNCRCVFLNVCTLCVYIWLVYCVICMYVATFYYLQAYTCWVIVCSLQLPIYIRSSVICEVLPHHGNTHSTLVSNVHALYCITVNRDVVYAYIHTLLSQDRMAAFGKPTHSNHYRQSP